MEDFVLEEDDDPKREVALLIVGKDDNSTRHVYSVLQEEIRRLGKQVCASATLASDDQLPEYDEVIAYEGPTKPLLGISSIARFEWQDMAEQYYQTLEFP